MVFKMKSNARIDLEGLKQQAELTVVVKKYLGAPLRTNGRGLWWRCPFHQEKTGSFLVGGRPDRAQEYHCFGCGEHGDAIEFVRRMENLPDDGKGFMEAVKKLAEIAGMALPQGESRRETAPVEPGPSGPPSSAWQARAREFCAQAQAALWQPIGAGCLTWLREVRGLEDETIKEFALGWNAGTGKEAQTLWGMPERDKPVWLPQGLVIPGEVDGVMWYVKLRPSKEVRTYFQGKYYQVPMPLDTERGALLGCDRWRPGLPILLCEGEIDLFTVWQECRQIVNAGTLGGAAKGRAGDNLNLGRWLLRLATASRILVAYDADNAGQQAEEALGRISERFEGVVVPWGTDVNEFHTTGGNVAAWLQKVTGFEPAPVAAQIPKGYPVTLVFDSRPGLAVIGEQWRRLPDGRLEAWFNTPEELATVLDVVKAIGVYGGAQ
jgi:DNA primase